MNNLKNKNIIFISGLHRSGTTYLFKLISKNFNVSSFKNTGFPMDEGQYLQELFPLDFDYIAPGKFAFNPNSNFTEKSDLLKHKNILIDNWNKYYDQSKQFFLEKSPPNLLRTRFLQEVFPNSKFITIIRHPIAVSYATKKWTNDFFLEKLIKHWIIAHKIYMEDRKYLKNELLISYEDFAESTDLNISRINKFLGIEINNDHKFVNQNEFYFNLWNLKAYSGLKKFGKLLEKKYLINKYESAINEFGYSLKTLSSLPKYNSFNKSKLF